MSRDIEDCVPALVARYEQFKEEMEAAGLPFMLTRTKCTQAEQDELYAQGRTKPGKIVTWTRNSRHITGEAFDIAIMRDGKPCWDPKVDVNADHVPDYIQAAKIGEHCGLVAGAYWNHQDLPHYQLA